MSYCRDYKIEMDYLRHIPPTRLTGGRLDRVGYENQIALLTVPVRSLAEIEPFRYYDVIVRRHFPEFGKGLPLKIKILGNIALDPLNYIGAGFKHDRVYGGGCGSFEEVGPGATTEVGRDCDVEIIEERVPAEIFDATMFGFGNAAMLDDIIWRDNVPYPFIRFYVNDEGKFVVMPPCCEEPRRPKRLIVKRVEVIREPFRAHTLAVKRTATPYVHPQKFEETEFWTQGNFGCGPCEPNGFRY